MAASQAQEYSPPPGLSWIAIFRLGLVQAALGSIVVLTTSTLNRVMVVELSLAAVIPGALVGLHYGVQITRPLWGHGSDSGHHRTPWIVGGVALLGLAGTGAAACTFLFERSFALAMIASVICFALIGLGIGAAGTSLLALLASRTAPHRRAAAASMVWLMMIAGIVVTAIVSGSFLDPFSLPRLVTVTAIAGAISLLLTILAVYGVERRHGEVKRKDAAPAGSFRESLFDTWADPEARLFTVFVFVSMLAYATQDLILEPFAGLLFAMTPGETTSLSGVQHGGVFLGMAAVGILGSLFASRKPGILRFFIISGCVGSALALALLAFASAVAPAWPLRMNIFLLGLANGAFAVAAIGTMMVLAGAGTKSREGIRMGLWGAAQAISFGVGGFLGTVLIDIARALTGSASVSFSAVFAFEAVLFLAAALIAMRLKSTPRSDQAAMEARGLQPAE